MTDIERAERLWRAGKALQRLAAIFRGEEEDSTGVGMWLIASGYIEEAMDVKLLTKDQWDAFTRVGNA